MKSERGTIDMLELLNSPVFHAISAVHIITMVFDSPAEITVHPAFLIPTFERLKSKSMSDIVESKEETKERESHTSY
jgi:hypothetical protein